MAKGRYSRFQMNFLTRSRIQHYQQLLVPRSQQRILQNVSIIKIVKIQASFDQQHSDNGHIPNRNLELQSENCPQCTVLNLITEVELKEVIFEGNSKTCGLESILTQLLKYCFNNSHVKKPTLNIEDMKNYRPVSIYPKFQNS